ncbi:phosphorylase b kinase regulatory subunit alpha, liver isoform-like [Dendronephthya gigantea]|uniref:phosphorylase b kinase regulatory subunit alpha, liver isoform-like n=1 Tax=Dendronephthya gigantea TaxID=151771 RepID=UPI00106B3763|nr:phosphorylase b kinase regulatory subunit alpha, liver isoform-like [Dendronephthya gigantea]
MRVRSNSIARLDWYHALLSETILECQDPVTGLLPPTGGQWKFGSRDYPGDAWVRDNVYGSLSMWSLALAYSKNADHDDEKAKAFELKQSVVKLMRGLLMSMMQQVEKVEKFKKTQSKDDALHAKYNYRTGETVVSDHDWGHLQIDATSLYLLVLAQMTASGLQIIFTLDEVSFIQNLVFYIEEAYRTPDYGIWERGDKLNHGLPELNASSIGMAKAALEALNGLDLFGSRGGPQSVIHVLPDEIQRCKAILQSMLPRESSSKEIAASVLSVISFPAFAVEDAELVHSTRSVIVERLEGKYGCRRFLRDGYMTALESPSRLHYEPAELKIFENVECEWPLFFAYLILDGIYSNNPQQVKKYQDMLDAIIIKDDGVNLMPELYYVPLNKVDLEKEKPHSQPRVLGGKLPHIWSQSLYLVGCLLSEGFLEPGELDPLNRRHATTPGPDICVQVVILAENSEVNKVLEDGGIPSQTKDSVRNIKVLPAQCLSHAYQELGKNDTLGLSGRPYYDIGALGTSSLYRVGSSIFAFTPQAIDTHQFYLCLDNELLADVIRTLLEYLKINWTLMGRPTLTLVVNRAMFEPEGFFSSSIGKLLLKIKTGYCAGVRVTLGNLSNFYSTSWIRNLPFLAGNQDFLKKWRPRGARRELLRSPSTSEVQSSTPGNERRASVHGAVRRSWSVSAYYIQDVTKLRSSSSGSQTDIDFDRLEYAQDELLSPSTSGYSVCSLDDIIKQLEEAESLHSQADLLHYLHCTVGAEYDTKLGGAQGSTVKKLLEELYEKACEKKQWSLVRHTAGLLQKRVEDLAEAVTDLLVREKQLTVGLPKVTIERVIDRPLPPDELHTIIFNICAEDSCNAVLTQELLVYLAMFIRTEPQLFKEMLRIRVGLITEVIASEMGRLLEGSDVELEDIPELFMNLSPFEMKTLLYHILSGKEFNVSRDSRRAPTDRQVSFMNIDLPKRVGIRKLKKTIKSMNVTKSTSDLLNDDSENEYNHGLGKLGVWIRRRRVDGALNRIPVDFYPKLWKIFEKCAGLSIEGHYLSNTIIQEMTPGEMKFALRVESALNCIPQPEYRQLMVEALMILSLIVETYPDQKLGEIVAVDEIVREAHTLFLHDQVKERGDASLCCCASSRENQVDCGGSAGICKHFYDSAPSGRYGTMTYFSQAVAARLCLLSHMKECTIS